jgi:diguanylate cyclase (GGDEF)-like protein
MSKDMTARAKRVAARTVFVSAVAVGSTFLLSLSIRWAVGIPMDWLGWILCLVIPLAISMPIGWYVFSQAENLRAAHAKLETAHKELSKTHERLTFLARHDHLTGLLNREGFLEKLEQSRDRNGPNVVLLADADHFKRINDKLGHQKGDEALLKIARALQYAVRPGDIVGRVGGEEFGILLVSADLERGARLAELVRRQVESIKWLTGDPEAPALTISVGGAVMEGPRSKVAEVLRQADRCLYEAKRRGRNRVSFSSSISNVA